MGVDRYRPAGKAECCTVNQFGADQPAIFTRDADRGQPRCDKSVHNALVNQTRKNHAQQLEIGLGSNATSSHECRFPSQRALHRRHLVTATVHHTHFPGCRAPGSANRACQTRVRLRSASDLHDAHHAGNPVCSPKSRSTLAFCTAWPAAPFTRLSNAEMMIRVGCRTFAALETLMRTTLRRTTSRSEGGWSAISMNGSP